MSDKLDVILRRFDDPDEVRTFEKGRFELVRRMVLGNGYGSGAISGRTNARRAATDRSRSRE